MRGILDALNYVEDRLGAIGLECQFWGAYLPAELHLIVSKDIPEWDGAYLSVCQGRMPPDEYVEKALAMIEDYKSIRAQRKIERKLEELQRGQDSFQFHEGKELA
jgi:hypothetical protein